MSHDLTTKLRDLANQRHRDRGHDAVDDALRDAADEIERLRVERKAEPVAWQWCAYEDGSQRTSWYPEGDSYQADWEELAKKYPDKYQVVTRPLYSTPPAAAVTGTVTDEMIDAAEKAIDELSYDLLPADIIHRELAKTAIKAALSASPSPVDSRDALIERLREENADLRSELYRRGQEADDTWLTERERAW